MNAETLVIEIVDHGDGLTLALTGKPCFVELFMEGMRTATSVPVPADVLTKAIEDIRNRDADAVCHFWFTGKPAKEQ